MIIFSSFALILTSLWNKGFILPSDLITFFVASLTLALVFYIILPLSKIILLPLNIITLGLVTFVVYLVILHFSGASLHLFEITEWNFQGLNIAFISIPKMHISYLGNLVLSSVSISSIINVFEQLL